MQQVPKNEEDRPSHWAGGRTRIELDTRRTVARSPPYTEREGARRPGLFARTRIVELSIGSRLYGAGCRKGSKIQGRGSGHNERRPRCRGRG